MVHTFKEVEIKRTSTIGYVQNILSAVEWPVDPLEVGFVLTVTKLEMCSCLAKTCWLKVHNPEKHTAAISYIVSYFSKFVRNKLSQAGVVVCRTLLSLFAF